MPTQTEFVYLANKSVKNITGNRSPALVDERLHVNQYFRLNCSLFVCLPTEVNSRFPNNLFGNLQIVLSERSSSVREILDVSSLKTIENEIDYIQSCEETDK